MRILGRMLVVLAGGLIALLPEADAATCKGGKRADSAGRCKATPAKKASTKAKAKAGKKAKTAAAVTEKGALYVFVESGGCRILATESSVRRMQEIAVGGSVTWDGRCDEGLISGAGVLRQEGVFIEGGRSKHFAYYYSGRAKNGVRTGPWTRESLERFDDSVRSWTSLARVEFANGVAKGAPKPIPVRGADQHSKSFTTRVLDPEAKRAQAVAEATPPAADSDALRLRAAPSVATTATGVSAAAPALSAPAPAASAPPAPPKAALPAAASAASPTAATLPPMASIAPPAAPTVVAAPTVPSRPAETPAAEAVPRVTASLPAAPSAVAPAPSPAPAAVIKAPLAPVPEPAKIAAAKSAPPAVAPAPTFAPPAANKASPPTPHTSEPPAQSIAPRPAAPATVAATAPPVPEPVKAATAKLAPPPVTPAPTPAPVALPKPPPRATPVAPAAAIQPVPAKPAVAAAPPPPAVKLSPALPDAMEKQAFGFGTGCYMDTLDGQLWENAVLTVKDRKSIRIDGWAVDDEERVLAEATYLRLEGTNGRRYHAATAVQERPDVARHFGVPAFVRSGYRAVVSAEGLPPGEYEVTIVMNSKGRNVLCGNGRRLKL